MHMLLLYNNSVHLDDFSKLRKETINNIKQIFWSILLIVYVVPTQPHDAWILKVGHSIKNISFPAD